MWVAARSEGVGMGWLSIMKPEIVKEILNIPPHVTIIAYMTVGFPVEFPDTPLLEAVGWKQRSALDSVVFNNSWNTPFSTPTRKEVSKPFQESMESSNYQKTKAEERLHRLTKPQGSLGILESIALQICSIQRSTSIKARHFHFP